MKRAIFSFVLLLLLPSCYGYAEQPEYPLIFTGEVNVSCGGIEYVYDVDFDGNLMNIVIKDPEILKGMSFIVNGDGITAQSSSFALSYEREIIDDFCPITYLYDVFLTANRLQPEFVQKDEVITADFSAEEHNCEMTIDAESGNIIQAKFDEYSYSMKA